MTASNSAFRVYIDESGDEGFIFNPDGTGSSRWLVLSAIVINRRDDLEIVETLKSVRKLLGKAPTGDLHFRKLKHEQRTPYIRRISDLPITVSNVAIYKPLIANKAPFIDDPHKLYRYGCRLLLERASWICRDQGRLRGEGVGADVIFSNRSTMSYEEIRSYIAKVILERDPDRPGSGIAPGTIDPNRITTRQHHELAGLQAADAVASSLFSALNINKYGETELAYLNAIRRVLYRGAGKVLGHGIKVWPGNLPEIKQQAPEASALEGL